MYISHDAIGEKFSNKQYLTKEEHFSKRTNQKQSGDHNITDRL